MGLSEWCPVLFVMRSDFSATLLATSRASLPTSGAFPNSLHLWSIPCRTRVLHPRVSFSQSRENLYSVLSFLGPGCLGNLLRAPTQFPRTTDFYPQPLKRGARSITLIEESGPQPFHALAGCPAEPAQSVPLVGGKNHRQHPAAQPYLRSLWSRPCSLSMWFRLLNSSAIRELRNQVQLPRFKIREMKLNRSITCLRSHNQEIGSRKPPMALAVPLLSSQEEWYWGGVGGREG